MENSRKAQNYGQKNNVCNLFRVRWLASGGKALLLPDWRRGLEGQRAEAVARCAEGRLAVGGAREV